MDELQKCDGCDVALGQFVHIHILTHIRTGNEITVCGWCFGDGWEGWRDDEESSEEPLQT